MPRLLRIVMVVALASLPCMGVAATERQSQATPRSVNDIAVDDWEYGPYAVRCSRPSVVRQGNVATVTMPCRVRPGDSVGRRGILVEMVAEVAYRQSGEAIGECDAEKRITKKGRFNMSCQIAVPGPATLPLTFSGSGDTITAPFVLPGGTLITEVTFEGDPNGYDYFDAEIYQDNGDSHYLDGGRGPLVNAAEVIEVFETDTAFIEVDIDADGSEDLPWTITIRDAFPE